VVRKLFVVAGAAAQMLALALTGVAHADPVDQGPEINPYECLGRYEAATGNRSMSQVREELEKRLHPLFDKDEPHSVRAMKLCVVARLEARLGDDNSADHFAQAVAENPEEPGYELFYGELYSGFRGARGPVLEKAEDHYYRALEKLNALRASGKYRDYHAVVEEWVHKKLLVLYQEDGLPLLPWKAYPQHGYAGHDAPQLSLSGQFAISRDTRDFFRNNEMRSFTSELLFAQSVVRANGTLTARQKYDIVRNPLRYRTDDRVRLRQNYLGALDLVYSYDHMEKGQIFSYYKPAANADGSPGSWPFVDTTVQQVGLNYERVFPIYPLFDAKLAATVEKVDRVGIVEFQADLHEHFWLYEARPSFSRFIGPDKLTLDFVYSYMNVSDTLYGPPDERLRSKYIRAVNLEYALYSPLVLPEFRSGELGMHRTPTRGWYFNAGAMDDDDVYGTRTVRKHDFYLGSRFEGAGNYDFTLQGTYATAATTLADPNDPAGIEREDASQSSSSFRTTALIQRRIINPDAIPGVNGSFIDADMMNLVIPITWDKGLHGPHDYENIRVGAELWSKFFGTGFGGPAFLPTVGYDYQYFYNLKKAVNEFHVALRMGWGKL
jgi:hypothetical protein